MVKLTNERPGKQLCDRCWIACKYDMSKDNVKQHHNVLDQMDVVASSSSSSILRALDRVVFILPVEGCVSVKFGFGSTVKRF